MNFEFFGLKSPYNRLNNTDIEKDCNIPNWQYPDSISTFKQLILEKKPEVIVELGTYLGWSAINMAKICKQNNINVKILCIDTWLGSIEHWRKDMCNSLKEFNYFEHGTSVMYDKFCRNVVSHGVEDYIIPLPNTTENVFKLLKHLKINADIIYVDASHEYDEVLRDLTMYYQLLNKDGYIFGDDVCWPEVISAAKKFSQNENKQLNFSMNNNLYYIKK
mgnify:FL=1